MSFRWKNALVFVVVALGLSGCGATPQGPYGGHSVQWFKEHKGQTKAEVDWCHAYFVKHGAAVVKRIQGCKAATEAQRYFDVQAEHQAAQWMYGGFGGINPGNTPTHMRLPTLKP